MKKLTRLLAVALLATGLSGVASQDADAFFGWGGGPWNRGWGDGWGYGGPWGGGPWGGGPWGGGPWGGGYYPYGGGYGYPYGGYGGYPYGGYGGYPYGGYGYGAGTDTGTVTAE